MGWFIYTLPSFRCRGYRIFRASMHNHVIAVLPKHLFWLTSWLAHKPPQKCLFLQATSLLSARKEAHVAFKPQQTHMPRANLGPCNSAKWRPRMGEWSILYNIDCAVRIHIGSSRYFMSDLLKQTRPTGSKWSVSHNSVPVWTRIYCTGVEQVPRYHFVILPP